MKPTKTSATTKRPPDKAIRRGAGAHKIAGPVDVRAQAKGGRKNAAGRSGPAPRHEAAANISARATVAPSKAKTKAKAKTKTKTKTNARSTPARVHPPVSDIFQRFADANPHPKGELDYTNAFTLLVAVVLSAQATDRGVNLATRELFKLADTPEKMCALGEDRVRELIKTIGLYRNKAKNVIALSEKLIAEHGSEVPADRAALESLPGVGRKTANVVLNIFFGQPTMAVDTHVFRVSHRLGLSQGKDPLAVETDLVRIIPNAYAMHAHHWLILHGRYVCKARAPDCAHCAVAEFCPSRNV